jgi:FixJ family two-component response regulator
MVYVVDHDDAARGAIESLLSERLKVEIKSFGSAEGFLEYHDGRTRGCVVAEFKLMGMQGLELQDQLNSRELFLPLVFVSGSADVDATVRAMRNGAVSVLQKPWQDEELVDAVAEGIHLEAKLREARFLRQASRRRLARLTSQEREVLDLVMLGKSNKQISYAMDVSLRTIERRRQSIFSKTNTSSAVELAELVRRAGYDELIPDDFH